MAITNRGITERTVTNRRADALSACQSALDTMESFMARARESLKRARYGTAPATALSDVIITIHHQCAWAYANAVNNLGDAARSATRMAIAEGQLAGVSKD